MVGPNVQQMGWGLRCFTVHFELINAMDKLKPIFLSNLEEFQQLENTYLNVRRREGRVLEDGALRLLPDVSLPNIYAKEWRWRKQSFLRFKNYLLEQKKGASRILDLGCGNGWMSNRLAENLHWDVVGVDVNQFELDQGARLFARENLQFYYAHLPGLSPEALGSLGRFDVIVLAASVQYFSNLGELVSKLKFMLHQDGEIHMIDSNFYKDDSAVLAAKQRTVDYYTNIGVPEMAAYYHHHLLPAAKRLGAENLNAGLWAKLQQKLGHIAPFPWLRLRHS